MSPERRRIRPKEKGEPLSVEKIARIATEEALTSGRYAPTIIVEGSYGWTIQRLEGLPDDQKEKRSLTIEAGMTLAREARLGVLERVSVVTEEGWKGVQQEVRMLRLSPAEYLKRKELIIVHQRDIAANKTAVVRFELIRNDEDEPVELVKVEAEREVGTEGAGGTGVESSLLDAFVGGFRMGTKQWVKK